MEWIKELRKKAEQDFKPQNKTKQKATILHTLPTGQKIVNTKKDSEKYIITPPNNKTLYRNDIILIDTKNTNTNTNTKKLPKATYIKTLNKTAHTKIDILYDLQKIFDIPEEQMIMGKNGKPQAFHTQGLKNMFSKIEQLLKHFHNTNQNEG